MYSGLDETNTSVLFVTPYCCDFSGKTYGGYDSFKCVEAKDLAHVYSPQRSS